MLKPFLLIFAVALLAIVPLTASAWPPQDTAPAAPKSPAKSTPESRAKAKKLYNIDCALCHGDTGDGKTDLAKDMSLTLLDWSDPKSLADHRDQELFNIIRQGKGKMPAEEAGRAKDDEVWGMIQYIRSMAKDQPATPTTPAVAPATPAAPATASTAPAPNSR